MRSRKASEQSQMFSIKIGELSAQPIVTRIEGEAPLEDRQEFCMKAKNIMNACLSIFITINLALEFEGQSSTFAFITDAVDCGLFLCCFCVLVFTIVIDI